MASSDVRGDRRRLHRADGVHAGADRPGEDDADTDRRAGRRRARRGGRRTDRARRAWRRCRGRARRGRSPTAMEAMFTTWPSSPVARIRGTNARTPWMTPQRFTSMHGVPRLERSSQLVPPLTMPALFTAMWRPPKRSTATEPGPLDRLRVADVELHASTSAPAARSCAAAASTAAASMSAISTRAPSAASAWAMASPMPLAAPVTTATCALRCSPRGLLRFRARRGWRRCCGRWRPGMPRRRRRAGSGG